VKNNKIVFGLFILFLLSACREGEFMRLSNLFSDLFYVDLETYIQNPSKSDTLCIHALEKAKQDVAQGDLVFTYPFQFLSSELRQEKQLVKLCQEYDLIFEYELFSDYYVEDQRQGCYGAYMDQYIANKFGNDFKEKLLDEADNLLAQSNDTVSYYLFDTPYRSSLKETINVKLPATLHGKVKSEANGNMPFMNINFFIDKEANVSGYYLSYFMQANNELNQEIEHELFAIGVAEIKKYPYGNQEELKTIL